MAYFKVRKCPLTLGEKWCDGYLVHFPTSVRYNGGTIIDGKWYEGYQVVKPKVPKGYELVGIAILDQYNVRPPYAIQYLKPLKGQSRTQIKADVLKANERWNKKPIIRRSHAHTAPQ